MIKNNSSVLIVLVCELMCVIAMYMMSLVYETMSTMLYFSCGMVFTTAVIIMYFVVTRMKGEREESDAVQ